MDIGGFNCCCYEGTGCRLMTDGDDNVGSLGIVGVEGLVGFGVVVDGVLSLVLSLILSLALVLALTSFYKLF